MRFIVSLLLPLLAFALSTSAPIQSIDGDQATAKIESAQKGLSGFVIRHFNDQHSTILASAKVIHVDATSGMAKLQLQPYEALGQNALPRGTWEPQVGDELRMGADYSRALLIAPNVTTYKKIEGAFKSIEWIHPDRFAAYLSVSGHPSPTLEDFQSFCHDNVIGLLYFHLETSLYTLDCQDFALLQMTEAPSLQRDAQLPFYSRVERVRAALWGEGSDPLESYAPHYLRLIANQNEAHPELKRLTPDPKSRTLSTPKSNTPFNVFVAPEED